MVPPGVGFLIPACTVSKLHFFHFVKIERDPASYDYGAAISENRLLNPKFTELKRQGLFLRSSPDFYKTDWIGNSSSDAVIISNPKAFAVQLSNPDTGTGFYVVRQNDTTST